MSLGFGLNLRYRNPAGSRIGWPDLYEQHLQMARFAEELGFEGVVVPEHHSVEDGYNPAPLVMLGSIAAVTTRIRLGTQILLLPLHNPILAAEELTAVDVLSRGRAEAGIGVGYRAADYAAVGVDYDRRRGLIEEGLALFLRALDDPGPFDFAGEHYRVAGVALIPRPVQEPRPPVALSVRSPAAARRAGRLGLSANILTRGVDPADLANLYVQSLLEAGFDPTIRTIATVQDGFIGPDRERAVDLAGEFIRTDRIAYRRLMGAAESQAEDGSRALGDPFTPLVAEDWIRLIDRAQSAFAGLPVQLTRINVSVWPPGMGHDAGRAALELFATTVMPRFTK
jgi:alkanesulfonate monooxygenase SsuD/methylene tetrahydromethanopterin reductase-like flavin-dependent oxidoreductase (luciferase family)